MTIPPPLSRLPAPRDQILYGVFLLFCPIGEAVSQTVQTYLPGYTVKRPPRPDGKPRRSLTFGKVGCFFFHLDLEYMILPDLVLMNLFFHMELPISDTDLFN